MESTQGERIRTTAQISQAFLVCTLVLGCTSSGIRGEAPVGAECPESASEVRQKGHLQIYPRMSSVGMVAKRTFYDSSGRPAKTIHRRGSGRDFSLTSNTIEIELLPD